MLSFLDATTEYPPQGDHVPKEVRDVCEKLGWICYFYETHPDGKIIVTFDDARYEGETHAMFEMSLEVVQRIARSLDKCRSHSSPFLDQF